jgi:hypothetical protein
MTGNQNNDDSTSEDAIEPNDEAVPDHWTGGEPQEELDTSQWVQVNQASYDRESDDELVTALVEAIADAKDADPLDSAKIPPLYESLDAAALEDTFFGPSGAERASQDGGIVTFHYTGYKVALRADGWIFVYESR